jgi:hypothetical protein
MARLFFGSVFLAFFVGCGGGETKPSATPSTTSPAATAGSTATPSTTTPTTDATTPTIDFSQTALPKLPVPDNSEAPAPKVEAKAPDAQPSTPDQRPGTVLENAKVGDGAKGHYSEGMILTPVATMFRAEEMIAFKIQIPQAMQYYKAEHEHAPKTHEEFMKKIIQDNHIELPELPEGQRFLYDPKTEQLMVERPAK